MNNYCKIRNDLLGQRLVENLKKRNFEAYYTPTSEEAIKKALEIIPEGSSISWGGSMSIIDMGLTKALNDGNYIVYDREKAETIEEKTEIAHKAFGVDYFLSSANAISEDGVIVNIDRTGNRLAAICYGPKNVLFIIGVNKVCGSESAALERARTVAAPTNAMRFDIKTPCKVTGVCHNCNSPECICSKILTIRNADIPGRMKVIIVGENLGF